MDHNAGVEPLISRSLSSDTNGSDTTVIENRVTFFPSLQDSRRSWMLDVVRREEVKTLVDIGCGEGSLIRCVCNSPVYLPPPESIRLSNDYQSLSLPPKDDDQLEVHLSHVAGLDVYKPDLQRCEEFIKPRIGQSDWSQGPTPNDWDFPRWEDLGVKLWHGSLSTVNEEFVGADCITASEVIEHLDDSVLSTFGPVILGEYGPRLLLLTTPNHDFNARFSPPNQTNPRGILDPTRRTDRTFRHYDHKFEWTTTEFYSWCVGMAQTYEYDVEVGGVGRAQQEDPWGRPNSEFGFATQIALFRRKDTYKRVPTSGTNAGDAHNLCAFYHHQAHPKAGNPESFDTIRSLVLNRMSSFYEAEGYKVWDLWVTNPIAVACGGLLSALILTIMLSEDLELDRDSGINVRDWQVKFKGEKHEEAIRASEVARLRSQEDYGQESAYQSSIPDLDFSEPDFSKPSSPPYEQDVANENYNWTSWSCSQDQEKAQVQDATHWGSFSGLRDWTDWDIPGKWVTEEDLMNL